MSPDTLRFVVLGERSRRLDVVPDWAIHVNLNLLCEKFNITSVLKHVPIHTADCRQNSRSTFLKPMGWLPNKGFARRSRRRQEGPCSYPSARRRLLLLLRKKPFDGRKTWSWAGRAAGTCSQWILSEKQVDLVREVIAQRVSSCVLSL